LEVTSHWNLGFSDELTDGFVLDQITNEAQDSLGKVGQLQQLLFRFSSRIVSFNL